MCSWSGSGPYRCESVVVAAEAWGQHIPNLRSSSQWDAEEERVRSMSE